MPDPTLNERLAVALEWRWLDPPVQRGYVRYKWRDPDEVLCLETPDFERDGNAMLALLEEMRKQPLEAQRRFSDALELRLGRAKLEANSLLTPALLWLSPEIVALAVLTVLEEN